MEPVMDDEKATQANGIAVEDALAAQFLAAYKVLLQRLSRAKRRADCMSVLLDSNGWQLMPRLVFDASSGSPKRLSQLKRLCRDSLASYVPKHGPPVYANLLLGNLTEATKKRAELCALWDATQTDPLQLAAVPRAVSWFSKRFAPITLQSLTVDKLRSIVLTAPLPHGATTPPVCWFVEPRSCGLFVSPLSMLLWMYAQERAAGRAH